MKKVLAAGIVAAVISSVPAVAAPPSAPIFNWTGFYAGVQAGSSWSSTTDDVGPHGFLPAAIRQSVNPDPSGGIVGAHAGYNYQLNMAVLGIETDLSFANIRGRDSVLAPNGSNFTNADQRIDWFSTVRGRIGFTPDGQWLVYGTGGWAFGGAKLNTSVISVAPCGIGICEVGPTVSKTLTGWTGGGGAEYALLNNWTFKFQYLYYDLGKISHRITDTTSGISDFGPTANFKGNIIEMGWSYKFGSR